MKRYAGLVLMMVFFLASTDLFAQEAGSQPPAKSQSQPEVKKSTPGSAQAKATGGTHASLLHPASLNAKAPDEYDAKFVTTKGEFVIHVTRAWAPVGADRF